MTLFKMVKELISCKEVKARCPECGIEYRYPEGSYKPPTCGSFDCTQKYLHPELSKERR